LEPQLKATSATIKSCKIFLILSITFKKKWGKLTHINLNKQIIKHYNVLLLFCVF